MEHNYDWKTKREKKAFLALEDGTVMRGYSVGAEVDNEGEVVFNTGMTGYQEIISDPSYAGQFVTMTYTEIGNYGVNAADMESRKLFLNGFIVHNMNEPSSWRAEKSLSDFLVEHKIPAIAGIDTRALTAKIRTTGTLKGYLHCSKQDMTQEQGVEKARAWCGLDNQDYAAKVCCEKPYQWDPDGSLTMSWGIAAALPPVEFKVVAFDFGIKWNILRNLRLQGMDVTVVPAKTTAEEVLKMKPDGVFLSNGPGDPAATGEYAVPEIKKLVASGLPMFGICLGHQMLGLALGAKTRKMNQGHHGANHPVKDFTTKKVEITSMNHGFTVDRETLPKGVVETHVSLFDGTNCGLELEGKPVFSVQYHPEASPGPQDSHYLFERFVKLMEKK